MHARAGAGAPNPQPSAVDRRRPRWMDAVRGGSTPSAV